ncbi:type IV secretory system conjugative DNA transfer family protein [Fimbriiglobus ruber]|nr:type IV secretory system conjugative DNA transfer family protein [Fimbriiglobus ruber]
MILALVAQVRQRRQWHLTAHGTARVAEPDELRRAGMIGAREGMILGRLPETPYRLLPAMRAVFDPKVRSRAACLQFLPPRRGHGLRDGTDWVRLNHAVHSVVFAPTGAGKGVSCILPFLFDSPESCVVLDFKGENAKLTARHRSRRFRHRTVLLDPFRIITPRPDTLNPLNEIRKGSRTAPDDIRSLAAELIVRTGQEKDPHWNDAAEMWAAGLMACVVHHAPSDDRSLQTFRGLFEPSKMETAIKLLSASDDEFVARMGHQLDHFEDRELSSALTTTSRHLRFLDTPAVAESTRSSSFDPAELRRGRMTIYLVLPPEHMQACMGLLRLWVGTLMRVIVRGGLNEENKVHFVLDEAASLGHGMNSLKDAVDKYRAYGIRCQFYYQSMGQLKLCWPEDQGQTLLSNTSQVFFAVNDLPTAEYVSNRLGSATIPVASGGSTTGRSRSSTFGGQGGVSWNTGTSSGRNDNWSQIGRKLLTPDECINLDPRTAITFTPGVPPVVTRLVRYFEEGGLTRPPGLIRHGVLAFTTFARALILLFFAAVFALMMTAETNGQVERATPRPLPASTGPQAPVGPFLPVEKKGRNVFIISPAPKGR